MTKYEKIAEKLRERIFNGDYKPTDLMPNQDEFASEFRVSRATIKKALNLLTKEGLISAQRGSGTRVLPRSLWGFVSEPGEKFDLEKLQIPEESIKNLSCDIVDFEVQFPDKRAQSQLLISRNQPVYHVRRLFKLENEPFILEDLSIPISLVPLLSKKIVHSSIITHISSKLKLGLAGTFRNIYSASATEKHTRHLNCQRKDPILVVEQVAYLKNGKPVEFSVCQSVGNRRSVTAVNVRTAG